MKHPNLKAPFQIADALLRCLAVLKRCECDSLDMLSLVVASSCESTHKMSDSDSDDGDYLEGQTVQGRNAIYYFQQLIVDGRSDGDSEDDYKDQGGDDNAHIGALKTQTRKRALDQEDLPTTKRVTRGSAPTNDEPPSSRAFRSIADQDAVEKAWKEMNEPTSASPLETPVAAPSPSTIPSEAITSKEELVKVTRTFKFAGDIISEEKWIPKSQYEKEQQQESEKNKEDEEKQAKTEAVAVVSAKPVFKGKLGGVPGRKKPSRLADMAASVGLKPTKLNTLEKSKMDWNSYVSKEGIRDELTHHNKDGYMEKQGFLDRSREKAESDLKAARKANR